MCGTTGFPGWLIGSFLLASLLLLDSSPTASCQLPYKLIKLPMETAVTEGAGFKGQPVISYYVPINIGTPAKSFKIQLDTALGDSFVPQFLPTSSNNNLHHEKGYDCASSSTCVEKNQYIVMDYNRCRIEANQYNDSVTFGRAFYYPMRKLGPGESVNFRHTFLAASDASGPNFKHLPVDGFFALAPRTGQQSDNLLTSLHKSNVIKRLQFSIWYNRDSGEPPFGGQVILGGEDSARYTGRVTWHDVSKANPNSWSVELRDVRLGNLVVGCMAKQCQAVLSTGQSEIFGPRDEVATIYKLLDTYQVNNVEMVKCSDQKKLPTLRFNMDDRSYSVSPKKYVRRMPTEGIAGDETCYVAIMPLEDGQQQQWILGTNFLEGYYTIFDAEQGKVGFANLK